MKRQSIRKYLKPQRISARRSTFNNAFASALAPFELYDDSRVHAALLDLGQDPDGDLTCVYCDASAETWDHLLPRVSKGEYSGNGHIIHNLVPSCRRCNERKGSMAWQEWIDRLKPNDADVKKRRIAGFATKKTGKAIGIAELRAASPVQFDRYQQIRDEVMLLLKEADEIAVHLKLAAEQKS